MDLKERIEDRERGWNFKLTTRDGNQIEKTFNSLEALKADYTQLYGFLESEQDCTRLYKNETQSLKKQNIQLVEENAHLREIIAKIAVLTLEAKKEH